MEGLRQRNVPVQALSTKEARDTVFDLNSQEQKKDESIQKTFGRTSDGTGKN